MLHGYPNKADSETGAVSNLIGRVMNEQPVLKEHAHSAALELINLKQEILVQAAIAIDAACASRDKRIAELEGLLAERASELAGSQAFVKLYQETKTRLDMARSATIGKIKPEVWRDIFERSLPKP